MRLLKKNKMRLLAFAVAFAMVLSLPVVPGVKAAGEEVILWVSGGEPVDPGETVCFSAGLEWPEEYYEEYGYDIDPPEDVIVDEETGEIITDNIVFEPVDDVESLKQFGIYVDDVLAAEEDVGKGQAVRVVDDAIPGEYKIGTFTYIGEVYTCQEPVIDAVVCVKGPVGDMIKRFEDASRKLSMMFFVFADGYTADEIEFAERVVDRLTNPSAKAAIQSAVAGTGTLIAAYDFSIAAIGNEEDENDFDQDMSNVTMEMEDTSYTGVTWYKLDPNSGYAIESTHEMIKTEAGWEGSLDGFGTYAIVGTKSSQPEPPVEYDYSSLTIKTKGEGYVTVTDKKTGKEVSESSYDKLDPKGTYVINAYPADGYEFGKWDPSGVTIPTAQMKKDEIVITNLKETLSLTAIFNEKEIPEDPGQEDPETAELIVSVTEGGTVAVANSDGDELSENELKKVDPEAEYNVYAYADDEDEYEFIGWSYTGEFETDADLNTESDIWITNLSGTVTLKALFKHKDKTYYSMTVECGEGGKYELKDSKGTVITEDELNMLDPEEKYTIKAIPDEGCSFVSWGIGDGIETEDDAEDETISFMITSEAAELSLEFHKDEVPLSVLTVKVEPEAGGTVSVYDSDGDVVSTNDYKILNSTAEYRLAAEAKDGYEFKGFTVEGAESYDDDLEDEVIISNLDEEVTVTATFEKTVIHLKDAEVTLSEKDKVQAYTGSAVTPKPIVTYKGKTLKEGTDYTVRYLNNVKAGTTKTGPAVVVVDGIGDYTGDNSAEFTIKKPVLKYRAYVQKKNWMTFQTATISSTPNTKIMAGTTDNLRMETIQMQLSGVGGEVRYRAYVQKKGWVGVGTAAGGFATTANKSTNAGTKGQSLRVEMIQLQAKGEIATLYDLYYQAYSEKFGWLAWAGNNEKSGSAGYGRKLCAFRVQLVPKGESFNKSVGSTAKKSFYDKTKDGANPK